MQIHFSEHQAGQRYAQTEGLQALGQQELAVPLFWQQGDQRDQQIIRLLKVIGQYISDQPKRITAGQTMQYGWSMLRFAPGEQYSLGRKRCSSKNSNTPSRMEMFSMCQAQPRPSICYGYKKKPSGATALRASRTLPIVPTWQLFATG